MNFKKHTSLQLLRITLSLCVVFCCLILNGCQTLVASNVDSNGIYQSRAIHSADGIGKLYLGREIAKVMGHTEALWLERPSREFEEQPTKLIDAFNLKPTDVIADIGAGTGYLSFRIAQKVPLGKVLAVDIQPEMLDIINFLKKENNITNVEPILGDIATPKLPLNSVDLVLMVDTYHELSNPYEMMQEVVKALKLSGRVVLVEYRRENPFIPIKALHKMTQKQVQKEMAAVGLQWSETQSFLPNQHLMIFEKIA